MDIIDKIPSKKYTFQISTVLSIDKSVNLNSEIEKVLILKGKIYLYMGEEKNIIQVYDCKLLKLISTLKLPFAPRILDIIEENSLIIYKNSFLYYYTFNLKEHQLDFKFLISNIYIFKFLSIKKEILFLMNGINNGWAKVDLTGQIIFYEKNKPNVSFAFKKFGEYDINICDAYNSSNYFHYLSGFNQDKYFIYSFGYYLSSGDPYDDYEIEENSITIFLTENLTSLYETDFQGLYDFKKISDLYFADDSSIYYYDVKENKIKENYLYQGSYYYINGTKFIVFIPPDTIYLIDLSNLEEKKKIKLNEKNEDNNMHNIGYFEENGNEYLYLFVGSLINKIYTNRIVKGIIK